MEQLIENGRHTTLLIPRTLIVTSNGQFGKKSILSMELSMEYRMYESHFSWSWLCLCLYILLYLFRKVGFLSGRFELKFETDVVMSFPLAD